MPDDRHQSCMDWNETTGDPDWREKVSALSDVSVPGSIPAGQHEGMTDEEMDVYRALLDNTRERQNGPYPGMD